MDCRKATAFLLLTSRSCIIGRQGCVVPITSCVMPSINCPGCKKQYTVPVTAAGQTATCKACGKRFRLGAVEAKPKKVGAAAPAARPEPQPAPDDAFWDEAISDDVAVEAPTQVARPDYSELKQAAVVEIEAQRKPKKRWGFQWE